MGQLSGKVAIVTGASRGIGQVIAELFASEGAKVVCAARTLNEGDHRFLDGSLARTVRRFRRRAAPPWRLPPTFRTRRIVSV